MSDRLDGGFRFGGVLVDLGDLFLGDAQDEVHANNYLGNTHGGLLNIGDDWYIFYHRQMNRSSYARQACAEKLERTPDGGFKQAEVTSCGLNGGPLRGEGKYEARIACNLWAKNHETGRYDYPHPKKLFKNHPYFTQTGKDREENGDQYIANMWDGAVAGFKYFSIDEQTKLSVETKGAKGGVMQVSTFPDFHAICCEIPLSAEQSAAYPLRLESGVYALYFRYQGKEAIDFISFLFS